MDALYWSCDELDLGLLLAASAFLAGRPVDLRRTKRYQLRASATFSWVSVDGRSLSATGYTRDISPSGVFVFSAQRFPLGTAVTLAMTLPSTTGQLLGATLNTLGRVVRSEQDGFAVAADTGLRMQFPEKRERSSNSKPGANGSDTKEAQGHTDAGRGMNVVSSFSI